MVVASTVLSGIAASAMHESGHWLVLDDIPTWKVWDRSCAMYGWHGTDHTLCSHDIAGIKEIYGAG